MSTRVLPNCILRIGSWTTLWVCALLIFCSSDAHSAPRRSHTVWAKPSFLLDHTRDLAIIIPPSAPSATTEAAELVATTLSAILQRPVPIYDSAAPKGHQRIYLGTRTIPHLEYDSFQVEVTPLSVFIDAKDAQAVYLAASRWLDLDIGVRWYFPGPLGTILPEHATIRLPAGKRTLTPAFHSRAYSATGSTPESRLWARRNGMRSHLRISHNLHRIFTYEDLHERPQLAAHIGTTPLLPPTPAANPRYHPDLASPEVAQHAAKHVLHHFAENPDHNSFSLGINDNINFGYSLALQQLVKPIQFFRQRPDYSNLLFTFMNRVAEAVAPHYPQQRLTTLAYYWMENVPDFPVHPNVYPILTADRSQYYDEAFRQEDLRLLQQWGCSGVDAFGLWEYYYGGPYVAPRLFFSYQQLSLQAAHTAGARTLYAEIIPIWAWDGAKLWITSRLTWDPNQDVDTLLDEYCRDLYGPAATYMRHIFQDWADAWSQQPGSAAWIKYYHDQEELAIYPPELWDQTDDYLEQALSSVPEHSLAWQRVALFARAYSVSKAAYKAHLLRRHLVDTSFESIDALMEALLSFQQALHAFTEHRQEVIATEPLLSNFRYSERTRQSDPSLSALLRYLQRYPQDRRDLVSALHHHSLGMLATAVDKLPPLSASLHASGNLLENPKFQHGPARSLRWEYPHQPALPSFPAWALYVRPGERARLFFEPQRTGEPAYFILQGTDMGRLQQEVRVFPGEQIVSLLEVQGHLSADARAEWILQWLDENGKTIGTTYNERLLPGEHPGWQPLALTAIAPEQARSVRVRLYCQRIQPDDFIAFRQPALYRVASAPAQTK